MNKDRYGLLKMGPVWDYDLAFGNVGQNHNQWICSPPDQCLHFDSVLAGFAGV